MTVEFDDDFLPEIDENVEGFETVFLELTNESISEDEINKLAFYAHNFKGSSQIAGLNELAKYLHEFENILVDLKSGSIVWNSSIKLFFFQWVDKIKDFGKAYAKKELMPLDVDWVQSHHQSFKQGTVSDVAEIKNEEPETKSEVLKKEELDQKDIPKSEKTHSSPEFIRTNLEKLDNLFNYVGELVINQSILNNYKEQNNLNDKRVFETIEYLNKIVHDISTSTLSLRMIPVKKLFQKIKRIASDVSGTANKQLKIVLKGDEVELDKTIVDKITDPIIHIIKNAIDHGIEDSELRVSNGKPREGTLIVKAIQKESVAEIYIEDDGGGLNRERILEKALEKGIINSEDEVTDDQVWNFIFHPGFSTASQVTEISGRGVGMDVVKKVIEGLQGNIIITSDPGKGTVFKLVIPLSLSIINGMIVRVHDENFIIPVSQLVETLELKNFNIEKTGKGRVLNLRGGLIPVISLSKILNKNKETVEKMVFDNEKALVVQVDGERISFVVDEIIEQQQIVVKKFGKEMEEVPGLSGGAILSDGEPGIILNIQEILAGGVRHV
ncbi:MAG: chemotaxis protein CheA [Bacteriovoracaceae bacterium]